MGFTFFVYPPVPQQGGAFPYILRVDVDGQTVWNNYDTAQTAPVTNGEPYEPARFDVTLTGIYDAMEQNGMRLTGQHTIEAAVTNFYFGEDHSVFVYDTRRRSRPASPSTGARPTRRSSRRSSWTPHLPSTKASDTLSAALH